MIKKNFSIKFKLGGGRSLFPSKRFVDKVFRDETTNRKRTPDKKRARPHIMNFTTISTRLKKGIQPLTTVIIEKQYKAVLPNLVIITT